VTFAGPAPSRLRRATRGVVGPVSRYWALTPMRIRLLLSTIGLLAVVCLVVGSITLLLLRGFLLFQLDNELTTAAHRSVVLAQEPSNWDQAHRDQQDQDKPGKPDPPPGQGPRFLLAPGQAENTFGAQLSSGQIQESGVLGSDGAITRIDGGDVQSTLAALPADGTPRSEVVGPLGWYRLVALHDSSGGVVITGMPLHGMYAVLARLLVIELVVAGAGVATAGAAAMVIVRITLRPLNRVAATAGRVAELPLDRGEVALAERVPERDTDVRTEVGQVGAALNQMLEHVAAALEARQASETQLRQFLADASHELRTPLAAIRGYAELAGRAGPDVPPDTAQALRRVTSQTERMTSLIEDMFLLARLDAGRPLAVDTVDLSQLVVDAVSDAHAAGPDHRWELRIPDAAVTVTGDATRLSQVLGNLLTNARVHTPPGTTVTAALDTTPTHAVLHVSDNGPGIPPGLLPHVFGRFARGDSSRSRAAGSTGLGLAIAHAVTTAHGGTLGVRSQPGLTTFTVTLPQHLDPVALPARRRPAHRGRQMPRPTRPARPGF